MRKKQICLSLLLACLAVTTGGCAVALLALGLGAGAGTVMYVGGDLETAVSEDVTTVYDASLKALEQLELRVTSKTRDALGARIIARDAADRKVSVKLSATAEGTTNLSIRIGTFGNETKSRMVYERIEKNLSSAAAAAK